MAYFSWLAQERKLTNASLTVRAQAISPNDEGRLLWDAFFPRRDVDSVKIGDVITNIDFRPVADRREWNTRGRMIPLRTPVTGRLEMVPIETFFKVAEREIQELEERTLGNEALFRQIIGATIPDRTDALAQANFRRIEIDAFTAWALGQVTVMDPVRGATSTVSYGFNSARYEVAGTAWNNGAVNAYNLFLAWLARATDLVGPISGVMLRLATLNEIKNDAPNPFSNVAGIALTRAQLEQRIQDELGSAFQFFVNENTQDIFTDGGIETVRTKVWPTGIIAAVPSGDQVGYTAFAPVARAFEVSRATPEAKIDVRGQSVFIETGNNGRDLTVECQVNAFTVPNENRIAVVNAGV
jgi:hypothetical protein